MKRRALAVALLVFGSCDRAAPPARTRESSTTPAAHPAATTSVAESLYFRGEYDSAAAVWKNELDSASRTKDSLRQATSLMWLGLSAWRQGDNKSARELGERALALKKQLSGNADLSRSYNALGLVARDEGRLRDGAALFDQAMTSARAVSDTAGVSRAAANLALIQLDLGEFDKARAGFEAARDAGHALGDERVEGNALNNLGMLTIRLGDPAGAIPLIDEALTHYRSIEYATGEQNSLGQLASAYDLLGEPQRALSLLDSASRIARAAKMRAEEASNLRLMGQVYQTMENHRRALAILSQAAGLSRELGLKQEEATILRTEAASHHALGELDLARSRTLDALRIHREEGAVWEELNDLLMLSELGTIAGDNTDASSRRAAARAIVRKIDAPSARAELAISEARIAARRNDWKHVLRIVGGARADLVMARTDMAWEPLSLRARAFASLGRLDSAEAAGRNAIAAAEKVRGRIGSAGLRTDFTSARAAVYVDQVLVLLRMGRTAEAFEVADAARGRALVEHLSEARSGIAESSATTKDVVRGEMLLRQIDQLVALLESEQRTPKEDRSLDAVALDNISSRIASAEREYAMIVDRVGSSDRARANMLGMKRTAARDVQRLLAPEEAIIEYLVADSSLSVFVVRAKSIREMKLSGGGATISRRVRVARELVARRGSNHDVVNASLSDLHRTLVEPVEAAGMLAGVKRLVIVPHFSLSYLPFAALRDARGQYLAQRYSVLTLPSAGAIAGLRESTASQSAKAASIVFAPFTRTLPASRSEARSVESQVAGTKTLLDDEASETAFREAAKSNRILHLATHGTLNAQNPLFSRIELARPANARTSSANDGRISVHELIGMRTASPLVFLSGCETALGSAGSNDFVRGEDYATLSQALLYSGARSAVATLWRINDESAAVFAAHFYRHLKKLPPAEALAAAQQNMLIDRRYNEPYHWAAYQVAGSGDRIALEERWWGLFAR
jgi:CHAT domain-containing protein